MPFDPFHQLLKLYFSKSDLQICSDQNQTNFCSENAGYENCGQVSGAKYQNHGCKNVQSETFDTFICPNRMDKVDILFKNPPVPLNKTRQNFNYNEVLYFDEQSIYCDSKNVSYESIKMVKKENPSLLCPLKNGKSTSIENIWNDLKADFSFKMSPKLDKLL